MDKYIDLYTDSGDESIYNIQPSSVQRDWMNDSNGWAYNCLPLKISNQYGWVAHSPSRIVAKWNGGASKDDMIVVGNNARSHFGNGILSFTMDFLVNTSAGSSLYVRGIPNSQKGILHPLDGIVETDWLPFHFLFSFRFLEPGTVIFEKGEPLFMFFPVERGYIDDFEVNYKSFKSNPDLMDKCAKYCSSRDKHMSKEITAPQKFYIKKNVDGEEYEVYNHRISMRLNTPKVVD